MKRKFLHLVLAIFISLAALIPAASVYAIDYENFVADYTEVDTGSKIAVGINSIVWTDLTTGSGAYVYRDLGTGNLSGTFQIQLKTQWNESTAGINGGAHWAVSNNIGTIKNHADNSYNALMFINGHPSSPDEVRWFLREYNGGSAYESDYFVPDEDTYYYVEILRDETVGTYGTLYAYIYSDSDYSVLEDTLTLALHEKIDFRYNYGYMNPGYAGVYYNTGETANELIDDYSGIGYVPEVITQGSISTSTGRRLDSLVSSDLDLIGGYFEVGTSSGNYTATYATTTNITGQTFTYMLTTIPTANLTVGQTYYYRAVAYNASGYGYGLEKSFVWTYAALNVTLSEMSSFETANEKMHGGFYVTVFPDTADNVTAYISDNISDLTTTPTTTIDLYLWSHHTDGRYYFSTDSNYGEPPVSAPLEPNTRYYFRARAMYNGDSYWSEIESSKTAVLSSLVAPLVTIVSVKEVSYLYDRDYVYEVTGRISSSNISDNVYAQGFEFAIETSGNNLVEPIYHYNVSNVAPDGTFTAVYDLSNSSFYNGGKLYFRSFADTFKFGRIYSSVIGVAHQTDGGSSGGVVIGGNGTEPPPTVPTSFSEIINQIRTSMGMTGIMGIWAFLGLIEILIALLFGVAYFALKESASNSRIFGAAIGFTWLISSVAALGAFIFSGQLGVWPILILVGGVVLLIILILSVKFSGGSNPAGGV